jgi:hypothetical protein
LIPHIDRGDSVTVSYSIETSKRFTGYRLEPTIATINGRLVGISNVIWLIDP